MAESVVAGNQFDIGLALQSAKGVTVADANIQYRLPVTGGGINAAKVINVIEETAQGRVKNTSYVAAVNVDGSPSMAARPDYLGLLLFGVFGIKTVTGASDPYEHEFELGAEQPYFTAWKRVGPEAAGGYYEKYRDCKITALTLASSAEGILVVTPTIMGLRVFAGGAAAPVAVDIDAGPVVFAHHHGEGAMLVDGVAVGSISDLTVTIGGDATRIRGNSLFGSHIAETGRNIVIDTTQLVDWALIRRALYGTATPVAGDAPSGAPLELTTGIDFKYTIPGTPERSLRLIATRVQTAIDPVDPNTGGEHLMMTAHHSVFQPGDGSSALTALLKNGVATYPAAP
jgi:hypothetical protein